MLSSTFVSQILKTREIEWGTRLDQVPFVSSKGLLKFLIENWNKRIWVMDYLLSIGLIYQLQPLLLFDFLMTTHQYMFTFWIELEAEVDFDMGNVSTFSIKIDFSQQKGFCFSLSPPIPSLWFVKCQKRLEKTFFFHF